MDSWKLSLLKLKVANFVTKIGPAGFLIAELCLQLNFQITRSVVMVKKLHSQHGVCDATRYETRH
jgi:hypothetical protein